MRADRLLFFEKKKDSENPKLFNDVCVLFKHSNFCSRILEMQSKRPRLQNVSRGHAPIPS